jgi:N utilization substance protein B
MNNGKLGIDQDYDIISFILEKIILKNKLLEEILEDRNIFWNDDIEFWVSNILQYLKKYKKNPQSFKIPGVWKDEEDKTFAFRLLKFSVLNRQKFDAIIVDALQKWELDRLALVDRSLLHLAICEYTEMSEVPVKVTINEYIEISKYYSTEKSSVFINGILDKIHLMLKEKGLLLKVGRGLADC